MAITSERAKINWLTVMLWMTINIAGFGLVGAMFHNFPPGVLATPFIRANFRRELVMIHAAANQLFRRFTEPARPNLVTGTLADLPHNRTEPLAENTLLRQ